MSSCSKGRISVTATAVYTAPQELLRNIERMDLGVTHGHRSDWQILALAASPQDRWRRVVGGLNQRRTKKHEVMRISYSNPGLSWTVRRV